MAERAKRRLTAAKLSVSVAVAAVLAGLAGRERGPEPANAVEGRRSAHLLGKIESPTGLITSADVKNHSLLYKDFKLGQIYSLKATNRLFPKVRYLNRAFYKIQKANDVFLSKIEAADTYLKYEDAQNTYLKISDAKGQFVAGDGSVFTGLGTSSQGVLIGLLRIPEVAMIEAEQEEAGGDFVRITNTSGSPFQYATPTSGGTLDPGKSFDMQLSGEPSATVQLLLPAVQKVATLTVSAFRANAGATSFTAQGMVGGP